MQREEVSNWKVIDMIEDPMNCEAEDNQLKEFQELCKPLVYWLQKNYRPSIKIEVTPDSATLYVGQMGTAYEWSDD